ncbi:MAG TPA: DUF481 domain-containing protein [Candidatus Omnitrophota bacterium]|nr:DUF481 domain-containing protein [Candidatus Omnitrophota bacterium]HPS20605.1 DUF481 domain-containing protein [Candidatus Omnitrophota bacterium]
MKITTKILYIAVFLICANSSYADQVFLTNGDKVSGEVEVKDTDIILKNPVLGKLKIKKEMIDHIEQEQKVSEESIKKELADREMNDTEKKEKKSNVTYQKREISTGFSMARGNTTKDELSINFIWERIREKIDQVTFNGNSLYSSTNKKADTSKWSTKGRYLRNFTKSRKWYVFAEEETSQDKFAEIEYRLVPAAGFGYLFYDSKESMFLAECATGWEHTAYRDETKTWDAPILIPRACIEQDVLLNSRVSQDICVYPSLSEFNNYRVLSETAFTNRVTPNFSLRLSLIDEYNSKPAEEAKKNDLRLISSAVCSF